MNCPLKVEATFVKMALPMFIDTQIRLHPHYVLSKIAYHKLGSLSNRVPIVCEQKTLFMVDGRYFRTPVLFKCGNLLDTVNGVFCF